MGVHQRIDRIAKRSIEAHVPLNMVFPSIHDILHFEGKNGPDGIKRKSPGVDEPWHFIDPYHTGDHMLFDMINDHIANLSIALRDQNTERAAFEASWLAHTVVDGLTPAHHYPFEEKLEELRGESMATRNTKMQKVFMPGKNKRHILKNNWEFWGAKGVMTTHVAFELGIASAISTMRFGDTTLSSDLKERLELNGYEAIFRDCLKKVAEMRMYEEFSRLGWTGHLAKETRAVLMPTIIEAVVVAWYQAIVLADTKS